MVDILSVLAVLDDDVMIIDDDYGVLTYV